MIPVLTVVLFVCGCAGAVEHFREKGIHYEEFGRATMLLDRSRCNARRFSLLPYVNSMVESEGNDVDAHILRTQLQATFASVCQKFNLTQGSQPVLEKPVSLQVVSGYLERYRIGWYVQKFQHDLRNLFLYNKINKPFFSLVKEKWYDEYMDVEEFAAATILFPKRCDVAEMGVCTLLCSEFDHTEQQGTLYAISHAGQFMPENEAFVFYDLPEYVVVIDGQDEIIPVEFESCKVLNGSSFVCRERSRTECDITTMDSCDILAESTANNFTFIRQFGNQWMVATNEEEVNINGTIVKASSPIFTYHTFYELEVEDGEQEVVAYTKITPIENEISFPRMSHGARDAVLETKETKVPIRLYRVSRKGIPILSRQPGKASVWDDVKEFFLHLI